MMRTLMLLLGCLAVALAVSTESSVRTGRPIPLHIPTQTVDSDDVFEVPYWLGAFYATVNVSSNWTLPLTIGNGGQTYPGEFLIIRNYGPADITLHTQAPETIESVSSYLVPSGTVIEILSGYPNWVITTLSNDVNVNVQDLSISGDVYYHNEGPLDLGNLGYMHTFEGLNPDNTTWFTVEIGANVYNVPISDLLQNTNCINIGSGAGQYNTGYNVINMGPYAGINNSGRGINIGPFAGENNTGYNVINLGPTAGSGNVGYNVVNIGAFSGYNNTATRVNNIGQYAGANNNGESVNNFGAQAGQNNEGSYINNIGYLAGRNNTGSNVNNLGQFAGADNTGSYCSHVGVRAGQLNTFDYCYTNGRSAVCTASNQFVIGSTAYPMDMRLPSDVGSWCTGSAYDTCQSRGAANRWTGAAGVDWYTETGHFCAGTGCTAMSAANVGVYDSGLRTVRSCTAGSGITCSVTDGVLTVAATSGLQNMVSRDDMKLMQERMDSLEKRIEKLLQLIES